MRILLVEDSKRLARSIQTGLRKLGHGVDLVHEGPRGLSYARHNPYELLILDILLPGLDGLSVLRTLRDEGAATPVLLLTARDTVEDRVTGLQAGADDYLVKPFAFRELLARVRALLRRDGRTKDPVLRVADLELDTVTRRVRRAGRTVELTSKEFAILEYFVRNPNRVLTRTEIAEHVWDYDFVSMSNVVDVYLGYLRRKLGDDREPRLLRTIRGTGYQLRVPPAGDQAEAMALASAGEAAGG